MFKILIYVLSIYCILGLNTRHYSLVAHVKYNSISSRNLMMEKNKELEFPEGRGGSGIREADSDEGSGIRFADSDDRGFPLSRPNKRIFAIFIYYFHVWNSSQFIFPRL